MERGAVEADEGSFGPCFPRNQPPKAPTKSTKVDQIHRLNTIRVEAYQAGLPSQMSFWTPAAHLYAAQSALDLPSRAVHARAYSDITAL